MATGSVFLAACTSANWDDIASKWGLVKKAVLSEGKAVSYSRWTDCHRRRRGSSHWCGPQLLPFVGDDGPSDDLVIEIDVEPSGVSYR